MTVFPSSGVTYATHSLMFLSVAMLGYVGRETIARRFRTLIAPTTDQEKAKHERDQLIAGLSIGGLVGVALMFLGMPSIVGVVAGVFSGYVSPKLIEARRRTKYLKEFDSQLAESLQTIGASLKAGLTLKDALMVAAENCPPVIAHEIGNAVKEYHFGVPIEEALDHVRRRVGTASCNIAFGAMIISSKLGGRLPDMLHEITGTIRERERVEGKLQSLTAQGRAQAFILCAAPPLMFIGMYLWDPGKVSLLTDFWVGQILLGIAIVLEVVGIFVTSRVLKLEV